MVTKIFFDLNRRLGAIDKGHLARGGEGSGIVDNRTGRRNGFNQLMSIFLVHAAHFTLAFMTNAKMIRMNITPNEAFF